MFLEFIREETLCIGGPYGMSPVTRTVARCKCGAEILLSDPMDNECDECGRLYNMSGQEVTCRAREVDWWDAGEVWDDDY